MTARLNWLTIAMPLIVRLFSQGRVARCSVEWHVERGILAAASTGCDMIKVYDRTCDAISLDEIERILI